MIKIIIIINVSTVPVAVRVTAVVVVLINSAVSNSTEKIEVGESQIEEFS